MLTPALSQRAESAPAGWRGHDWHPAEVWHGAQPARHRQAGGRLQQRLRGCGGGWPSAPGDRCSPARLPATVHVQRLPALHRAARVLSAELARSIHAGPPDGLSMRLVMPGALGAYQQAGLQAPSWVPAQAGVLPSRAGRRRQPARAGLHVRRGRPEAHGWALCDQLLPCHSLLHRHLWPDRSHSCGRHGHVRGDRKRRQGLPGCTTSCQGGPGAPAPASATACKG